MCSIITDYYLPITSIQMRCYFNLGNNTSSDLFIIPFFDNFPQYLIYNRFLRSECPMLGFRSAGMNSTRPSSSCFLLVSPSCQTLPSNDDVVDGISPYETSDQPPPSLDVVWPTIPLDNTHACTPPDSSTKWSTHLFLLAVTTA